MKSSGRVWGHKSAFAIKESNTWTVTGSLFSSDSFEMVSQESETPHLDLNQRITSFDADHADQAPVSAEREVCQVQPSSSSGGSHGHGHRVLSALSHFLSPHVHGISAITAASPPGVRACAHARMLAAACAAAVLLQRVPLLCCCVRRLR
jgi:hypothetical protein